MEHFLKKKLSANVGSSGEGDRVINSGFLVKEDDS